MQYFAARQHNVYGKFFQSSQILKVEEFDLSTNNGCISMAIANDIFAEVAKTTDQRKGLDVRCDIATECFLLISRK